MKKFNIIMLLFALINTASAVKKIPANDHDALAKEGIIILSEEHARTPGVSSVPPVEIEIINPSHATPSNKNR